MWSQRVISFEIIHVSLEPIDILSPRLPPSLVASLLLVGEIEEANKILLAEGKEEKALELLE